MILNLVRYDNEILSTPAKKFDFKEPPFDPLEFAMNLVETMNAHGALGLAAVQVGVPYRVIAIPAQPNIVMYNPIIVDKSEETMDLDEGCLTYPGLILKMKRSRIVKVRYAQPNGNVVTEKYTDHAARAIQHEIDHIDGLTILTSRTGMERYTAQKKWAKIVRRTGGAPASIRNSSVMEKSA